jgi:hypothetical protein
MPIPQFNKDKAGEYSAVAAATLWKNYSGVCAYVKYKKGPDEIKIVSMSNKHVHVVTPDRELYLSGSGSYTSHDFPSGDKWEECYDFNICNDVVAKSLGINATMTNFSHETPDLLPGNRDKYEEVDNRVLFLSDSGGLQVVRGKCPPIDPRELAKFYAGRVDAGMALDLPIANVGKKILTKAAELQRDNNSAMLKVFKDGGYKTEILNILHGSTLDERRIYRDIVDDKRINRVALGGLYRSTLLTATNIILETCVTGQSYDQCHVLGINNYLYIALITKIANVSKKFITSDTTSHIQHAVNRNMCIFQDEQFKPKVFPIGRSLSTGNPNRHLASLNPVASVLKYTDIFALLDTDCVSRLLSLHNFCEMNRYAKMMQKAVVTLSNDEYNKLVYLQMKGNRHLKSLKLCFDFLELYQQDGLKVAQKVYAHHINRSGMATLDYSVGNKQDLYLQAIDRGHRVLAGEKITDTLNLNWSMGI